jgi:hypothetical protein
LGAYGRLAGVVTTVGLCLDIDNFILLPRTRMRWEICIDLSRLWRLRKAQLFGLANVNASRAGSAD